MASERALPEPIGLDLDAPRGLGDSADQSGAAYRAASASSSSSTQVGRASASSSGDSIGLDFRKAGIDEGTKGQALAGQPRPGAVPAQASEEDVEFARRAGMPVPEASARRTGVHGAVRRSISRTLLGIEDRNGGILAGVAVGLLIAAVPATRLGAEVVDDRRSTLLTELEASVTDPLGVEAGEVRPEREIRADLVSVGSEGTSTFVKWWLLVGLPLGAGLGLYRRET